MIAWLELAIAMIALVKAVVEIISQYGNFQ